MNSKKLDFHYKWLFVIGFFAVAVALSAFFVYQKTFAAFTGPTTAAGTGSGAIGVDADGNLGVGGLAPISGTRFLIKGEGATSAFYSLQILDSNEAIILSVRGDGRVGIKNLLPNDELDVTGNIRASGSLFGSYAGNIPAANIISGVFNNGGTPAPFAFESSLGVGYASQVGLPATLSVNGTVRIDSLGSVWGSPELLIENNSAGDLVPLGFKSSAAVVPYDWEFGAISGDGTLRIRDVQYGRDALYIFPGVSGALSLQPTGGNVGIGLNSGIDSKLTVAGTVESTLNGFKFPDGTTQTTAAGSGQWTTDTDGIHYNANNVGVGQNSIANNRLTLLDDYPSVIISGTNYHKVVDINGFRLPIAAGVTESGYRIGLGVQGYVSDPNFLGTLTNQYGIWARHGAYVAGAGSSIINSYGVFVDSLTNAGIPITNLYGLYQANSAAKNYFAGNVGIGMTNPGVALDVNGDVRVITVAGALNRFFRAEEAGAAGNKAGIAFGSNAVKGAIYGASGVFGIRIVGANSPVDIGTVPGSDATDYASYVSRLFVKSDGNVGIGTTVPGYKLDVQGGQVNVSGGLCIAGDCKTAWSQVGGIPGGISGQVQFNNAGAFGGSADLVWNDTTDTLTIGATGAGKLNVGTVDPIYTIGGKQYATYLPSMTGVKEETTGVIQMQKSKCKNQNDNEKCQSYKYIVDFDKVEEGSDLWLFAKTTNLEENFDKMAVLLTPAFDGRAWYEKDLTNNSLTIYSIPTLEHSDIPTSRLEISYRFTAPRFDYSSWSNYSDGSYKGFDLDEFNKSN